MKAVVRILSIIILSGFAAFPALAQDGGKAPEPKARVDIVRQDKIDSRNRDAGSDKGQHQQEENGKKDRPRADHERPHQVSSF